MKNLQLRKKINNPEGNYPPLHHAIINLSLDLGRFAESPNKKYCRIIPEITFWLFKMDTEVKLGVDCDKDFQQKLSHIKECQDLLALISIGFEHIFRLRYILFTIISFILGCFLVFLESKLNLSNSIDYFLRCSHV